MKGYFDNKCLHHLFLNYKVALLNLWCNFLHQKIGKLSKAQEIMYGTERFFVLRSFKKYRHRIPHFTKIDYVITYLSASIFLLNFCPYVIENMC